MIAQRVQLVGWIIFIFYYFTAKYFVGGFTGFSVGYLISVIMLVMMTAVIPFYTAKWLVDKSEKLAQFGFALLLPILLTGAGLSVYFVIFIAPNYPAITLPGILHRAIEPGVAISILLLVPIVAGVRTNKQSGEGA